MFFCVPIIFGCQTTLKPDGEQQYPRVCPRCHNASVIAAKSTTWFEIFWVPLVPFAKKHIWLCSICQWREKMAPEQEHNVGHPQPGQGSQQNQQAGYAPAYIHQVPGQKQ